MVSLTVHLFGKPEWEFGDNKITPETIISKGDELKERLHDIADVIKKLSSKKWEHELGGYELIFTKDISKKDAEKELKELGIKKDIYEIEDEEAGYIG